MGEIAEAAANLADPVYWIAVVTAAVLAAATGLIPGASGIVVMSLAIPFIVFNIKEPAIGLVALATITGVNNGLDTIPAILLGQPGAGNNVSFLEGHQLARQGKAAHTLGAVYAVSMMGGVFGALTLAMVIPIMRPFILSFSFAEIAMLALFGVAMVSGLSQGAMRLFGGSIWCGSSTLARSKPSPPMHPQRLSPESIRLHCTKRTRPSIVVPGNSG